MLSNVDAYKSPFIITIISEDTDYLYSTDRQAHYLYGGVPKLN